MRITIPPHRHIRSWAGLMALLVAVAIFAATAPAAVAGTYINNWVILDSQSADNPTLMQYLATHFKVAMLNNGLNSDGARQAASLKGFSPSIIVLTYTHLPGTYPGQENGIVANGVYPGVQTTLASAIASNTTTITVADGSAFPTSNFWIKIDSEVIEIASRSGNTMTVKSYPNDPQPDDSGRGTPTVDGTAWQATSHSAGATVYWAREDWFRHDINDGSRLIYKRYGWYHMDVSHPGWRQQFADFALAHLTSNMNGIFTDDTLREIGYMQGTDRFTRVSDYTAGRISDAKVNSLHADTLGMLVYVKGRLGSRMLVFNGLHGTSQYEDYLDAAEGACHEQFVHSATEVVEWNPNFITWQADVNRLIDTQVKGKLCIAQNRFYVVPPTSIETQSHLFSLASYLLGCGPTSYFGHYVKGRQFQDMYYALWDIPIGTPTGSVYVADGLYQRDFTNGKALVNPYDSGNAIVVNLPRPYRVVNVDGTINQTPVTSVSIPIKSGVILIQAPVTVAMSAAPSSAAPQSLVDYTVTYQNTGTAEASNVVVSSSVPANTDFVSGSARLNGSPISPDPVSGSSVVVNVGTVAAGAQGTVRFQVRLR